MDWHLVSFVARSELKYICLQELNKPTMPSKIANKKNKSLNSVTRAIHELMEKDLVQCLTPDQHSYRIFGLTEKGKEILKQAKEIEK